MSGTRRRSRVGACVVIASLALACHGAPRSAPTLTASAPACPPPPLTVADWPVIMDSADVSYRLPDGFVERRPRDLPGRHWTYRRDGSSGTVTVGFIHSREHWTTLRRVPSPGMHEMSVCIDSLAGREILVQAWRMANGIFRNRRRFDRYDVFALLPITPGHTVYVTGGGSDRRFQEIVLAIVRTVRLPSP